MGSCLGSYLNAAPLFFPLLNLLITCANMRARALYTTPHSTQKNVHDRMHNRNKEKKDNPNPHVIFSFFSYLQAMKSSHHDIHML